MIASAQTLRKLQPITPFVEKTIFNGMSYGLSSAGYDIRVNQTITLPPQASALASSVEEFNMPLHLLGMVCDKSSWARKFLACQNTIIEPGWKGYLTLELTNHSNAYIHIEQGSPIAQIIFHLLDQPTDTPYNGKYQSQPNHPVKVILETSAILDATRQLRQRQTLP